MATYGGTPLRDSFAHYASASVFQMLQRGESSWNAERLSLCCLSFTRLQRRCTIQRRREAADAEDTLYCQRHARVPETRCNTTAGYHKALGVRSSPVDGRMDALWYT